VTLLIDSAGSSTTTVPTGYELVVESITGEFRVPTGASVFSGGLTTGNVNIRGDSGTTTVFSPGPKEGTDGTNDWYSFSQPTKFYVDPGKTLSMELAADGGVVTTGGFSISGYLVQCGSGTGCPAY
jgi:hypothetical protein